MNSTRLSRLVRRSIPALAALVAGGLGALAAPVVWDSSAGGNGNTYDVIVDNTITWDAAQAAAQAAGGNLATITSQAEQSFIESALASANAATGSYWFGIRETATEGVYQSVTGEAFGFTNWTPGEPNNANTGENVGAVLWTANGGDPATLARRGTWNDEPASGYPAPGLPTPAQPDVLRGGYLLEIAGDDTGGGGGNDDGGGPRAVPLPAAAYVFPIAAAFAGYFHRRMRRRT